MKKIASALILALILAVFAGFATADEGKAIAVITKIELAADGKSAVVVLKNTKTEEDIEVDVTDDLTLDKFKDHRIVKGDEIRLKWTEEGGRKLSTYFRKTAGC